MTLVELLNAAAEQGAGQDHLLMVQIASDQGGGKLGGVGPLTIKSITVQHEADGADEDSTVRTIWLNVEEF